MANYTKQAASFTGLRGTVADPSVFDAEFNLIEATSRTKADKELPNTFLQAQTFNKSPTIPAGGTGNQPLTATEVAAKIAALESAISTLLAAKAPIASPTLTGAPRVPTVIAGDSSTLIASTAFVQNAAKSAGGIQSLTGKKAPVNYEFLMSASKTVFTNTSTSTKYVSVAFVSTRNTSWNVSFLQNYTLSIAPDPLGVGPIAVSKIIVIHPNTSVVVTDTSTVSMNTGISPAILAKTQYVTYSVTEFI